MAGRRGSSKVVIVGGGIGGLCTALCFERRGWDVTVVEQAAQISEVGAGIQISPNGMKVLAAMGLDSAVEKAGFLPLASQIRLGTSGKVLMTGSMKDFRQRHGAAYVHIHRADLVDVLRQAVEQRLPGAIQTGQQVTGYVQDSSSARAVLANGQHLAGDLLIGADGIRSVIRAQMIGTDPARFTGNVAWRAVVPVERLGRDVPLPVATVWLGEGRHAVTYLLRGGQLANFVGVVERNDWQQESWTEEGSPEEAAADFAGWHPVIARLIGEADQMHRWALFDRAPLDRWSDGRVTLLGDAAHAMLPFLAQGATQAMEDGFVLARLASQTDLPAALSAYFDARQPRTARVQAAARANMDLFHQRSAPDRLAARGAMRLADRLAPKAMAEQLDWLYSHDVTA